MWATPNPGQILYSILYKENNHFSPLKMEVFIYWVCLKQDRPLAITCIPQSIPEPTAALR